MSRPLFNRCVTALLTVCLIANPALAQQPLPELMYQQAESRAAAQNMAAVSVAPAPSAAITVDAAAEAARQASLKESLNGTRVVDISAPTAGGVSHNLFSEFNVGTDGVIFNNSLAPVLTELGGWADGNRRLAGGEASIILNEVTGNSRSNLLGHIEIAGKSAEFVLANPSGISCDGCGFINTPRVTLVTGRANLQDGKLNSFDIRGGDFRLDGKGLNAANVDRFDILTRAASINAQVYAQQLNVITGVNTIDYNTDAIVANTATTSPGIQIALDASSLGAMYANSIRLVGTEQGMGVNSQGLIQSVNDLELTADGNVVIKNAQANAAIQLKSHSGSIETFGNVYANSLHLDAKNTIDNYGLLGAAEAINLTGETFIQRGNLYAGLDIDGKLNESGHFSGEFNDHLENHGTFYVGGEFSLRSSNLINEQGQFIFQSADSLQVSGDLINKGLIHFNSPVANVAANNIDNSSGRVQIAGDGSIRITANEQFKNNQGVIKVQDDLQIHAQTLDNSAGVLNAGSMTLDANELVNELGDVRADELTITAGNVQNRRGLLVATGTNPDSLRVNVEGNMNNSAGNIIANADTRIDVGSLDNSQGNIQASGSSALQIHASNLIQNNDGNISAHNLSMSATDLHNNIGTLLANGLTLDIAKLLSNSGQIQAQQVNINATDYVAQGGVLLAQGTADNSLSLTVSNAIRNTQGSIIETAGAGLRINSHTLTNENSQINLLGEGELNISVDELNNQSGQLAANNTIAIAAASVRNSQGLIQSQQLTIDAPQLDNSSGSLVADQLQLTVHQLENTSGLVTGQDQLSLNANTIINNGGVLGTAAGDFSLSLQSLNNNNGKILHAGQGLFSLTLNDLLNIGGSINSNSSLNISASDFNNTSGSIAANQLSVSANQIDNSSGTLLGVTQLGISTARLNNNSGSLQGRAVNLSAQSLNNQQGNITASDSGLGIDVAGEIDNQQGVINSGQQLSIAASALNNNGGTVNGLDLMLNVERLTNIAGLLQGGQIDLHVPHLDNTDGTIAATSASGSGLRLNMSGDLNNKRGTLFTRGGALAIDAAQVNNNGGSIHYAGTGTASITGTTVENNKGHIYSTGDLTLATTTLSNQQGLISTAGDAHFQVANLIDNSQGKLMAAGKQTLHTGQLINTNGIASADQLRITSAIINNLSGGILEANQLSLQTDFLKNEGSLFAASNADNSLEFNVKKFLNSGRLEANSENLLLDRVDMKSTGGEIIHGGTGTLHIRHKGEFNNRNGILASQGIIKLDADSLDNRGGEVLAEKQLQVSLSGLNNQAGVIQTGDGLELNLQNLDNSNGGQLIISGSVPSEFNISTRLNNNGGSIIYWGTDRLQINADIIDNTNRGLIGGTGSIVVSANQFNNTLGNVVGDSLIEINAARLQNRDGRIESQQLRLNLDELTNSGSILARDRASDSLSINTNRLINTGLIEARGINFTLTNANLDNTSGVILHGGSGALSIEQHSLVNQAGVIQSAGDIHLNLNALENLNAGEIAANNNLQISVQTVTNDGLLQAANAITFDVQQLDNLTNGQILALGNSLALDAPEINNQGVIAAHQQLTINSDQLNNSATGVIQSNHQLDLVSDSLVNSGFIAADQLTLGVRQLSNTTLGQIQAGSGLLSGDNWVNDGLVFIHDRNATSQLQLNELHNQGLLEILSKNADITLNTLVNTGGDFIYTGGGILSLDAVDIDNQQGQLAGHNIQLTANQINNSSGEIISDILNVDAQVLNNQAGHLQANTQFTLKVDQLDNRVDGLILSSGNSISSLNLGQLDNRAGTLAINHLDLQATSIDNRAGELIADNLVLRADALDNTLGAIATTANGSDDNLQIAIANTLDNTQGLVQGGGKNSAITVGELRNSQGDIIHTGAGLLAINTGALNNTDTGSIHSNHQLALSVSGNLLNENARISAGDSASLTANTIVNRSGTLIAQNAFSIHANQLTNSATALYGQGLISSNWLQLTIDQFANESGSRVEAEIADLRNAQFNNAGLLLVTGTVGNSLNADVQQLTNAGRIEIASENLTLTNSHINNSGEIIHRGSGTLHIDQGELTNDSGLIDSSGQLKIDINHLSNLDGVLVARAVQGMNLNVVTLDNTQGLLTADELHINSENLNNTLGEISGNNLVVNSDQIANAGGIISATDLTISAQTLTNNNASGFTGVIDADNVNLVVDQLNNQASIQAQQLDLRGSHFNNNDGLLLATATSGNSLRMDFHAGISNQRGHIESQSDVLTLNDDLDNSAGQILLAGAGQLTLANVNNYQGKLLSNGSVLFNNSAAVLNNAQGLIQALGDVNLQADEVNNHRGTIAAGGLLAISAEQLDNRQGLLLAESNLDNSLQLVVAAQIDNTDGIIETYANNFSLDNPRFINTQGEIRHLGTGTFALNASSDFTNTDGLLFSRGNLDLAINGTFINQGQLVAKNRLDVSADSVTNQSGALMDAANTRISSLLVENAGRIQGNELELSGDQLNNQGGEILALASTDNSLQLNLRSVDNSAGGLIETYSNNLNLHAAINNQGGSLLNLGLGTLSLSDLFNRDGNVYAAGNLTVAQTALDNRAGYLEAKENLLLQVDDLDNRSGYMRAGNNLEINSAQIDNSQVGQIQAVNGFSVIATGAINNDGGQLASLAQHMTVSGAQFSNSRGQVLHQGTGNLVLDSGNSLHNNAGQISTQGKLTINTDRIENNAIAGAGALIKARDLSITANSMQNRGGQLEASEYLTLTLPVLDNENGNILSLGSASNALLLNTASLSNRNGVFEVHSRDLDLSTLQLDNQQGVINHRGVGVLRIANNSVFNNNNGALQSSGTIQLDVDSIENRAGLIRADQLRLNAQDKIDNSAGGTLAGNLLQLSANNISNNAGLIAAQGNNANALVFDTQNIIDNSLGVIRNGATNWSLQLENINNTGGSVVHLGSGVFTLSNTGTLANTGTIASVADLHINAVDIDNQGNVVADKNLVLNVTGTIANSNTGLIKAGNLLTTQANEFANQGEINAAGDLSLQINQQFTNSGVLVGQGNSTAIAATTINNTGTLAQSGVGELLLTADTINNNAGAIKSLSNLRFQANTINNGSVISAADFTAAGFNQFSNSGYLESGSTLLSGNRLDNQGTFNASGSSTSLSLSDLYNSGTFYSGSYNQSFNGSFTNAGQFIHTGTGTLSLGGGNVTLSGGSVSTAGAASLSGSVSGSGSLFAKSGIAIGGGSTFTNNGSYLYTQGDLAITSAVNNNSGSLIADGRFNVNTTGDINNNNGLMQGQELNFVARMLSNIGGTIISTGSGAASITANAIDNSGSGKISATNNSFTIQATAGDINNQSGSIIKAGAGQLVLTASGQLNNQSGSISTQGQAVINTGGDLINTNTALISADSFLLGVLGSAAGLNNTGGNIFATGSAGSSIESRYGVLNTGGHIAVNSNDFEIKASGGINNSSGTIDHFGFGLLSADYSTFANTGGTVRSNGAINWSTAGNFVNAGEISALTNLTIDANTITNSGTLGSRAGNVFLDAGGSWITNEASGSISGLHLVDINTWTFNNAGTVQSSDTVNFTLKSLGAVGNVSAGNLLSFNVQDSINIKQGEKITSNGSLSITTQGHIDNAGTLSAEKTLTLDSGYLGNTGSILGGAEGESSINVATYIANNGRISSANDLKLTAHQFFSYGTTAAAGNLNITTTAEINNLTGNVIFSGKDMTLNVSSLSNSGTIFSLGNMGISATHFISNDQARIESIGSMWLSANYINNNGLTPLETITKTPRTEEYLYSSPNSDCNKPNSWSWGCRVFSFSESTHYDYTTSGAESVIAAGGNLSLNGNNSINNLYGVISTGGDLTVSGGSWTMTSAQDKTRTRTGTVVYVGTGPCSHCVEDPNEKGVTTVTAPDANSTPIGIVRVVGNISGSLAGSVTQTVNGHSSGNQSADTSTAGPDGGNNNRGNHANAASGNGASVNVGSGSAANTAGQSLAHNGAVNGSGVVAGGIGGGLVGSATNLNSGAAGGSLGAAGVYNASTAVVVDANGIGAGIASQAGTSGSQIDSAVVAATVNNHLEGSLVTGVVEDIEALKQRAFDALFGEPANTDASSTNMPGDNASNIGGEASNLGALDAFALGTNPPDSSELHAVESATPTNNGSAIDASTSDLAHVSVTGSVGGVSGSATSVSVTDKAPQPTVVEVLPADFNPKNVGGLYVENKAPGSNVLIETRPEFTEYSNFLGSDYLLDAIGYNPDKTIKRLGDAFFENQLIRDALVRQTNTRFVGNATNDYDQMQALMNNAVAANQSMQLSVGVALTKEQASALTSDIVWLVEKTVNGEKVLVPELYLASLDKATLLPSGAVMSAGGKMDLWSGNGISTQGTIASGGLLSLGTLGNFNQNGTINSNTGVMLTAGQDFTNRGKVNGPLVSVFAGGDITNLNNISATNFLGLTGDSITNTASGKLQSGGWLNLTAQNDIRNQQGLIEGVDVNLVSREGSIINRTEFTTFTSADGRSTSTSVGAASTILSHNSLRMDAGKDLDLQGSQFKAAQDITLKAGNDILLGAIALTSTTDTSTRKVTTKTSETRHQVVSIEAGHQLTLDAGRDLNAEGTQFKAGVDASLNAGRDLNLSALADTTHSESLAKRKKVIDTQTTHTLVDIQSGGNVSLTAGQDANLTGTNVNAAGNVSLAAARDVNLTAVVDSDYHYDYTKKKKSFGRSKTTENETLDQTVTGGVIAAGGNVLINAVEKENGDLVLTGSRNVNMTGALIASDQGDVVIASGEDVNINTIETQSIDYHVRKKSGVGGLTGKGKSATHNATEQVSTQILAGNDAMVLAGGDATLTSTVIDAKNNIQLDAGLINKEGDLTLLAAENTYFDEEKKSKKSLSLKIDKDGVTFDKTTKAANDNAETYRLGNWLSAGGNIDVNAERDVTLEGSTLDAGKAIDVNAGRDVNLLASQDDVNTGKERSVSRNGISWSDNSNGVSVFAGEETNRDRLETRDKVSISTALNSGDNTTINAGRDITLAGAEINSEKSITLDAKRNVTIGTSDERYQSINEHENIRDGLTVTANHNLGDTAKALESLGGLVDDEGNAVSDASTGMKAVDTISNSGPSASAHLGRTSIGQKQTDTNVIAFGSTLNAKENVDITAGEVASIHGSQVSAKRNITVDANDINITAAENTTDSNSKNSYHKTGLDLQGGKGNVSLTAGFTMSNSEMKTKDITASASTLNAENISLNAKRDVNVKGSDLNAEKNIAIDAGRDVSITSADEYTRSEFDSEYKSLNAGINFGKDGIGFTANGSIGEEELDRTNIIHRNSTITAGETLSITSGNDTTIKGANVSGKDVDVTVGNNLTIASEQNTGKVKGQKYDASFSITVGAGVSASVGLGYGETEGSSAWVADQTSLTGSNSLNVKVKNHTQLDGAVMGNITTDTEGNQVDGNNFNFTTNTFGYTDLKDHDKEKSTYVGVSIGGGSGSDGNAQVDSYGVDAQYSSHNKKQDTYATLGNGNITIQSDSETGTNSLGNINRDLTEAQVITKDKSRNVDVYVNSDTIETLTNTEKRNQLVDRITNPGRLIGEAFQFGGVADDLDNAFSTVKDGHISAPTDTQLASMTQEQQQQAWADYDRQRENQGVIKTSDAERFDNAVKYTAGSAQDWLFHVNDEGGIAALGMGEGNDFSKMYGEHKAANELLLPTRNNLVLDLNSDGKADFDGVSVINNATDNSVETNQLMARIMVGTIAGFDVETLLHTDAPAAGASGQAKGVTQDAEGKPKLVGINVVKTDISNVDDYVTTIAEEGRHAGSDNDINANIFARQFASNWNDQNIRDDSKTGGQLGISQEDWLAGNSNNRTLNANNERIGQLDIKDLHFRQLSGIEADKIIEIADQQSNGDANLAADWRKRLTRQALRQVDANHYTVIPEDTEARQLLGGKSAGQASEVFTDVDGKTRNIFYAQGDEFKNSQIGKSNAASDIVTADIYEEAGKDKSLTTLQQTPRNAPNDALPEEKVESSYVTWMNSCNSTGGNNCNAYAYDQFAKEEQAKSDVRTKLAELENTASSTKKTCDANDEACQVKADLNAYNQRLAGELKSMGVVASTAAEFLNLPYGVYTTVDSLTKFVEQNGDSVVQLITENPTAAAAAGVTAVCAATPSCRAGLKNWIDPPVNSPSVVTKVDDVPKGVVTKADEVPKKDNINEAGLTDSETAVQSYTSLDQITFRNASHTSAGDTLEEHLIYAKISGKQVSGGHNMDEFNKLVANGDVTILNKIEISPGIYEIEYQVAGKTPIDIPKTVYDPKIYSDQQMIDFGKAAVAKNYEQAVAIYKNDASKRKFESNSGGIKFTYYLNKDSNGNIYIGTIYPSR
ncbi:MAG: hemagglutinin repeat-containing protein [Cellvibrio sp.]|uniref:hemagglutinin repeat-containing protein n=1 Tax=Cellvibrio sp. TaxID=1965322 RepID=UPI0027218003|nr:hemagglutinin repeat-containing protein [Cellvibrio sp.]